MESFNASSSLGSIPYDGIVEEMCRRVRKSNYYTTDSTPLFLRGVLTKYERTARKTIVLNGEGGIEWQNENESCEEFVPKKLTDALISRLTNLQELNLRTKNEIEDEHGIDDSSKEDYFTVATALLRGDPAKFLPAFTSSVSDWIDSLTSSQKGYESIPMEFFSFWVSLIADHSIPLKAHDAFCNGLLNLLQHHLLLASKDDHFIESLFTNILNYVVNPNEKFWLSLSTSIRPKNVIPTSTTVLRSACFLIRFLSRCGQQHFGFVNRIFQASDASNWFVTILNTTFEDSKSQSNTEFSELQKNRLHVVDVLLQESTPVPFTSPAGTTLFDDASYHESRQGDSGRNPLYRNSAAINHSSSMKWITSIDGLSPAFLTFLRNTLCRMVEIWKKDFAGTSVMPLLKIDRKDPFDCHGKTKSMCSNADDYSFNFTECATHFAPLDSPPNPSASLASSDNNNEYQQQSLNQNQLRRDSEIVSDTSVQYATRFVRVLARLSDSEFLSLLPGFPEDHFDSEESFYIIIDKATAEAGMELYVTMLQNTNAPSVLNLRLVRLLIDEFATPANRYKNIAKPVMEWVSSPAMEELVWKQCVSDPFLWSLPEVQWYFQTYTEHSSSKIESLERIRAQRETLRAAPPCHKSVHTLPVDLRNTNESFQEYHLAEKTKRLLSNFRNNIGRENFATNRNRENQQQGSYRLFN